MAHDNMDGALLEMKLVGDITGSFRVPHYQRGFRWGKVEVERLLDDVWENGDKDYSLQPIVVKREAEGAWELVDGQQRLTTLYLIFIYMERAGLKNVGPGYTLTYSTRPKSPSYLRSPDPELAGDNIDFFHMHGAYACIQSWFERKGPTPLKRQEIADDVFRYLMKRVRVIWYEASHALSSTDLFRRLNVGRIPLTDAELFKALLLSRSRGASGEADRAHEIAAQWDGIERDLQDPDIWAFVADASAADSPTRITLLLDTIAGGPRGRARPRFHTFDVLRARLEQATPAAVWNEVVELHARVRGWYENRDDYHKIGYLVAQKHRFGELAKLAEDKAKSAFDAHLDALIRDTLDLSPSELSALTYDGSRQKCEQVLLLMNVETTRRTKDSRYSFLTHRGQAWSLEHIHAQHPEGLTRAEQWEEWLKLHRDALATFPSVDETRRTHLLQRIDGAHGKLDRELFQALARDIAAVFTKSEAAASVATHSTHSISNLALLECGHNSALGNATFEVKRRRILQLDREGAFIPICTRQVFLKYYTDANDQQLHFWSTQDREAYLAALLSTNGGVGSYLRPEDPAP